MFNCRFLITAMYDDSNGIRHTRRLQFTKGLLVSPVGIRAFKGLTSREHLTLYNKGVVYDATYNIFDVCLDGFVADDKDELDTLFKFWGGTDTLYYF